MKFIFLFNLFIAIVCSVAHGSIYMEPYLGGGVSYSKISADDNLITPPQYFSYNFNFGLRTGYEFFNLRGGLDIFHTRHLIRNSFGIYSVTVQKPPISKGFSQAGDSVSIQYSNNSENFNPTSFGLFGAIDLPFLFDVYGTVFYSFGTKDLLTYRGPGLKVGLSYVSLFFVQFNIELQFVHYFCKEMACLQPSFNMGSMLLSVSVPFSTNMFTWNSTGTIPNDLDSHGPIENNMVDENSPITQEM